MPDAANIPKVSKTDPKIYPYSYDPDMPKSHDPHNEDYNWYGMTEMPETRADKELIRYPKMPRLGDNEPLDMLYPQMTSDEVLKLLAGYYMLMVKLACSEIIL